MRVKTEERRRAIVEAAKSVFLERGYAASSMAEVSARAGGSKQTLYSYFPSKEDLFVAVMLEEGARQIDPLFDGLDVSEDLAEALIAFADRFTALVTGEEALSFRRMILAEGAKSSLGALFYEHGPKRAWGKLADLFAKAMEAGRMRRVDPTLAVDHFVALCESGPFQRLMEGAIPEVPEAQRVASTRAAVEAFLRAYGIEAPKTAPASA